MLKKTKKVLNENEFKRGTTRKAVRNIIEDGRVRERWIDLKCSEFIMEFKNNEEAIAVQNEYLEYISHKDLYYRVQNTIYVSLEAIFGTTLGEEDILFIKN